MTQVKISVAQSVMLYHFLGDDNALYQFKDNADNKKNAVAVGGKDNNVMKVAKNDESDDENLNNNRGRGRNRERKKIKKAKVKDQY